MITVRALRTTRWIALGLIVLIGAGFAFLEFGPVMHVRRDDLPGTSSASGRAVALPGGIPIGGPFKLIDDKGQRVSDADYRGRWMLVFFGYTNCPDECPLTLQKMAAALKVLGPLAGRIAPLFITVDPARDTPIRLASYLENFDPRIIGLTGSTEQVAEAAKAYRVYYSPAEHEQSGADILSHSAFLYLMNPNSRLDSVFDRDIDASKLAAVLRARLAAQKRAAQPS